MFARTFTVDPICTWGCEGHGREVEEVIKVAEDELIRVQDDDTLEVGDVVVDTEGHHFEEGARVVTVISRQGRWG